MLPCKIHHVTCLNGSKLFKQTSTIVLSRKLSTNEETKNYDIIIVGGGVIGTTLACTLGKNKKLADKSILLLEARSKKNWTPSEKYSKRVSMLNPSTKKLFEEIGVWKHISDSRYAVVKKMQIWDGLSDAFITFNNNDSEEDIGYVIENDLVLKGSTEEADCLENVNIRYGEKINNYHINDYKEKENAIILSDGSVLKCKLLLGCDGPNSQMRKAMGVKNISWNYDQTSIVATLELEEELDNIVAWQRMLPGGPIALLPLTSKLSSLVWSTDRSEAKNLLAMSEEQFVEAINNAWAKSYNMNKWVEEGSKCFNSLLTKVPFIDRFDRQCPPKIKTCEPKSRAAFPIGFSHATSYIGQGVALLGDAAHKIHPLAGQGVNLGYGDIITLNKYLTEAVSNGADINDISYLKEYESCRQSHNLPTMLAVDGLNRLYGTDFTPLVLLRSLGLQVTHGLLPLKRALLNHAST